MGAPENSARTLPAQSRDGRLRWPVGLTIVLTLGLVAATFLQSSVSVLSRYLIEAFGLSRSDLGLVLTVFGLTGAATAPLMGRAADVLGGRGVLVGVFVATIAATLLMANARGVWQLVAAAVVGGLGLGAGNPATNKLSTSGVSVEHQGAVMGIKQAGPPLGVLVAGVALPGTAAALGWRPAFAISAVLPLVGLAALYRTMPSAASRAWLQPERVLIKAGATVWWPTVVGFLVSTGAGAIGAFLPLYAQEMLGLSTPTAGALASLAGVMGIVGRVAWGWQAFRFRRMTLPLVLVAIIAVIATGALWAADGIGSWMLWIGASLAGVSILSWHALGWLVLVHGVEPGAVGGASGIMHLGSSVGFGLGPLLFGLVVDGMSYSGAWALMTFLFVLATGLTWLWHRRSMGARHAEQSVW
jgi:predicted MFS family arabinose efflux permease